ncbi:hypothetical protein ACMCO3_001557 [Salmonella enterica]|nr:hypothetical protein [Salmonella enterica]EBG0542744.1 hypothetical protein [Salmonella enterica subsp. enterica serovar Ank]EBR8049960.1 hypothetical protein [Salmonella enterica subsp. enterica serovar Altona]EDH6622084.1 hypothetical protein [Salmonella enterica subsp. enterica serovar Monschaui]EDU9551235.1 hypothetical protein [Salmonella enterica subsp. enterica]EDV9627057.1 hypothetical protein [Salmonella enterica subsp. enterica serovar Lagos]EIP0082492.1 hypothetical protein [Sal
MNNVIYTTNWGPGSGSKNGGDGGDGMYEARIAKLESDVESIRKDVSDLRSDIRSVSSDITAISRDTAVMLQKLVDIDSKLSTKPSIDSVDAKITSSANKQIIWTVGSIITAIGIATGLIIKLMS